ncbi:MDR/zinc-dependent alcohol dehydrogenase-like family protein [Desulfurococcus mucosus]|uniref:Alcohol dehydrogenase GroES domain protein n=1 Tax=Desulfurococcus mucosus (strain ATCC 35584 / DSM 2162 / JCM 9187 / O7/1) TaxID=765177 RepID=E8RAD0_DESM0|nr:alcohol dehydrogenase catalytic domain-containing protein [Desulfurococcus mucosus]ADV64340.1 Alcohol dehydrogenase GroES domain protein [Desulfurococcus mucosus DSM 2162]
MKALLLEEPKHIRLTEVEQPSPGPGWLLIRVERAGICGTDKAMYTGTYRLLKKPLIPGHEVSGIVVDVGAGVSRDLVGRRVTTEINVYCGKCWYCRNGMHTHCPYRETIGITRDGGMAEYMVTRADLIHVVDDLSPLQAAFVEPLAAVVEMVEMEPVRPLSRVAVIGVGAIGLLAVQVLRLFNPELIVAVSRPGSPKARLAGELGADLVVDYPELTEILRRETPEGQGFDYVVEATGSSKGLEIAVDIARPRGVVALKSTHGSPVSFDQTKAVIKELRLTTSRCGPFDKAISLLRKRLVNVDKLVTSEYGLEKGAEAFEKSLERDQVKVHIVI